MLDAMEDWQLSSRESLTDLLFTEGQSRETYNVATSNVYANWENGVGNLLGDKPEGTGWEDDGLTGGRERVGNGNGLNQRNTNGFLTGFEDEQAPEDSSNNDTDSSKGIPNNLPKKKKEIEPGKPGYAMQEIVKPFDAEMKRSHWNFVNPASDGFVVWFGLRCIYTGVFIESRAAITAAHDAMRTSAAEAAEESKNGYEKAAYTTISYGLNAQESFLLATNRFAEGGLLITPVRAVGLTPVLASPYVAVPAVGYGSYSYGTKLYEEGMTPENFGDGILIGAGLLQVSRQPSLMKPTVGSREQLLLDNAESIPLEKLLGNTQVTGGRVFTSTDSHVGGTATQLEALFPKRVLDVNKHLPANVAGGTREVDILMDQFVIQVKGGRATGLAGQMQETAATLTDKSRRIIGYAPDNYSTHAWTRAANEGIPIARNFDELVAIIKELTQ